MECKKLSHVILNINLFACALLHSPTCVFVTPARAEVNCCCFYYKRLALNVSQQGLNSFQGGVGGPDTHTAIGIGNEKKYLCHRGTHGRHHKSSGCVPINIIILLIIIIFILHEMDHRNTW